MPSSAMMWPLLARIPAIVEPERCDDWLDKALTCKTEIQRLLDTKSSGEIVNCPVSDWLNSSLHDVSRCIQAAAPAIQTAAGDLPRVLHLRDE